MIRLIAALALTLSATPALAQAEPGARPVTGSGTSSVALTFETGVSRGAVMVALFDSQASYDGGAPVGQARVDVAAGGRTATFGNLPAGDYAARAFHDVNGDGEMNTNPFGMPTEPYAFSNNAVGNMGPASWERARFDVSGETAQTITIR